MFSSIYLLPAGFVFLATRVSFCCSLCLSLLFPTCLITSFCFSPPLASLHILLLWPLAYPIFMLFPLSFLPFLYFFFLSLPFYFSLSPVSAYWLPLILFCLITLASLLGFKAFVLYSFHPLHSDFLSFSLFSAISLICSWCFLPHFLLCALSCHVLQIPSLSPGQDRGCSAPLMTSRSAKK